MSDPLEARRVPGVPARAWLGYLVLGSGATWGYYLVPATGVGLIARVALYVMISMSPAVAIVVVLRRWGRSYPRTIWLLLAASQVVCGAGDVPFYIAHYVFGSNRIPPLADLLYVAHYPLVFAALILLIRHRAPGHDRASLIDAAILTVSVALLSWLFVVGPQFKTGIMPLVNVMALAYPLVDLATVVVALRLVLGPGRRPSSFHLLSTYLVALLTADAIYGFQQLHGSYTAGNFIDLIWLSGNLALGAAALHPSARWLNEPVGRQDSGSGPPRMIVVTLAGLVGPAAMLLTGPDRDLDDVRATASAWAVLFLLTVLRMHGLVVQQRRIATTDELTGLSTRRCFQSRLAAETARVVRGYQGFAVFMVDVDHFKTINDRYGHPAGDRALVEIARRLRAVTRQSDMVARYGGEEFALLMATASDQDVSIVCECIRRRISGRPVVVAADTSVDVTVSIGAAMCPLHGGTPEELIAVVDKALYRAKACGRDRAVVGCSGGLEEHWSTAASPADRSGVAGVDFLRLAADQVDLWLETSEHSQEVSRLACLVAIELGYDCETAERAELAGRFHDVGKIVIPDAVLAKPESLSDGEWQMLRRHPDHGARLLRLISGFERVAEIVRQHHERYDGTGYPDGLAGQRILPEARVLAVCDSWAAMCSDRPYKAAIEEDQAVSELRLGRGTQYDPQVVDAFVRLWERGGSSRGAAHRIQELQAVATGAVEPTGRVDQFGLSDGGALDSAGRVHPRRAVDRATDGR